MNSAAAELFGASIMSRELVKEVLKELFREEPELLINVLGTYPEVQKSLRDNDTNEENSILKKRSGEKIQQFKTLLHDPEIKECLNYITWDFLATSDLQIITRLAEVEKMLSLSSFVDEDEEINFPKQIELLSQRVDDLEELGTCQKPNMENDIHFQASKSTAYAMYLHNYLKTKVKPRNEEIFLTSPELMNFFKNIVPEEYNIQYTIKTNQNVRKLKKDVLEKALIMFPNNIFLSKKKTGRREVRVIFRP
ncbi:hypothetical protein MSSAC_0192 [Methanosarcina siciliae C2J]|uniref:Uncharacterized protein n=1 Tax=Methanosarcina siciliae C2J TaxID=1434118 RepID=A0A0E3PJG2_9EURY|nr:hypothetical protein [Methanosarcina siciliae]AKB34782.1 hypothetical protein MSSAC_0192 [Methanosarcina siciliae C2J]